MMVFKFGRYYKHVSLFADGHGHHNGLAPLRNIPPRPRPFSLGHRVLGPQGYPDQTQFIRLINQQIEHNYEQF